MEENGLTRRDLIRTGIAGAISATSFTLAPGCAPKRIDLKNELSMIDKNPSRRARHAGYMDAYAFDDCIECGQCLKSCIYKDLTEDQAVINIRKMRAGDVKTCDAMLDLCVLCSNCNFVCPVEARPAALMLARLQERREREGGAPSSLMYAINGMEEKGWDKNMFRDLYTAHDKTEQKIIKKWSVPKKNKGGDLLWCSCASRIFPYDIENSRAFADLPKFGGISDCCGLAAFRSGLFDVARYLSNKLIDRLSQCEFSRLVVLCGSCQDMFIRGMPEYLGQKFPFEVISAYEYIDEQLEAGKLSIKRKIPADENKVCITHSCFAQDFGKDYNSAIRRLYRKVGYDCTELYHRCEKNACCGMGGFYRDGSLWDIFDVKGIKKDDIKASGRKDILAYCYGCYITTRLFYGGKSNFLMEKLMWAMGDDIKYPLSGILGRSFNFHNMWHMLEIGPSALT